RLRRPYGDRRRSQGPFDARPSRTHRPPPVTSVLIVRLGSLGDVVHAIPAAAALRAAFPIARIDWATHPSYLPLLDMVPVIDNRIGVDTRQVGIVGTVGRLRRAAYEVVLDLQGLLKSAVLARAVGASRTIGFPREH